MDKKYIVGAVIGILVAVSAFHIWYLYKLNSRVLVLEAFATNVANIINSAQQAQK